MTADFVESKPLHKAPYKSGGDILESQYKGGRAVIDRHDWARASYDDLRRRCTHVPDADLVRLFNDRSQSQLELIVGDAVFREYNATRPLGRKRVKVKPRPASKVVVKTVEPPKPAAKPAPKAAAPPKREAPRKKAPTPSPKAAKAKPKASKAPARKASKAKARRR
jgi:hypothetical protein